MFFFNPTYFCELNQNQKVFQNINRLQQEEGGKNHVLRVVIENPQYEVGLQVFKFIFSKFGDVLKIITFTKNSKRVAELSCLFLLVEPF